MKPEALMTYTDGRCAFIEQRDGPEAARAFAQQGVKVYRSAVLSRFPRFLERNARRHHCSLPEYRKKTIQIYLEMKRYPK